MSLVATQDLDVARRSPTAEKADNAALHWRADRPSPASTAPTDRRVGNPPRAEAVHSGPSSIGGAKIGRQLIPNQAVLINTLPLLEVMIRRNWEAWLLFFLDAVEGTTNWTAARTQAIRCLVDHHERARPREASQDPQP
jgi:hypothetical protein